MATQTGSIDLEATNAAKLYAEAGFTNAAQTYATKSELTVSANNIKSEVAETYATKSEAALELSGSGKIVVLDGAADARLKALTIHGLSQQDGTPTPSAPVPIRSVESRNLFNMSAPYQTMQGCTCSVDGDSITITATTTNAWPYVRWKVPLDGTSATLTVQSMTAGGQAYLQLLDASGTVLATSAALTTAGGYVTLDRTGAVSAYVVLYARRTAAGSVGDTATLSNVMLQDGAVVHRFAPYGAIPIFVSGKNLLDTSITEATYAGVTYTQGNSGEIVLNGTKYGGGYYVVKQDAFSLQAGTYTFSAELVSGTATATPTIYLLGNNDAVVFQVTPNAGSKKSHTVTLAEDTNIIKLRFGLFTDNSVYTNATYALQLEAGSTATAYEPYSSTTTTPIPVALRSLPDGTRDEWISGETEDTLIPRFGITFNGLAACTVMCEQLTERETLALVVSNAYSINGTIDNRLYFSLSENETTAADAAAALAAHPITVLYKLATPITTTYPHVDLPYVSDGDSVWVDAQVTPTIDVTYWSENGETVSALSSTLTQTAAGLELELQGKVDSDEEWVSWMHAGTDPTTHEPYLAMGQDSDYPSVVYGSGEAQFYDGEGDVEHNILARFGSNGAIIGRSDESHITQTATTTRLFGSDGILVLEAGFQNVSDGHGSTKQGVRVTDSNNASYIAVNPTTDSSGFDGKLDFDVYCKGIGLMSSSGGEVVISSDFAANGLHAAVEARKTISGTEQIHGFTLGFDPNDNPYVNIDNPAVWLAALGLTVQEGAMTFASGLNSSYGSAPVRKYGAMGILKLNSVRLAAQLASGGSVVIGTLPTGYVPVGSVDMHINIESNSSNYRNNYIVIEYSGSTNPGRVTLYNRSGAAIPNTVTFSCTCPFFIG